MYGITTSCDLPCPGGVLINKRTDRLRSRTGHPHFEWRCSLIGVRCKRCSTTTTVHKRGGGAFFQNYVTRFLARFDLPPSPHRYNGCYTRDIIRTNIIPCSGSLPPRNAELDSSPVPLMINFLNKSVLVRSLLVYPKKTRVFIIQAIFVLKISTSCERITSVLYIEMKHKILKSLLKSFFFV